ncbi:MAG: hypothetical protein IK125_07620 [Lachnospiraceae bacterium]|nr:hypothetical protein [Lachnospiraceae bacterium]
MKLDEKWIRAHLPEECRDEPLDRFSGFYLDGLKVMAEGERGNPDKVYYEAKDEEDLKWWQLDVICGFVGRVDRSKTWRWYRDHAENGQWYYIEYKRYDYNAIEDSRLPGFERYLRNLKYAFPEEYFRKKVKEYTGLMNYWFRVPHWGYDYENLCFIEISDSMEFSGDADKTDEIKPECIVRVVD